MYINLCTRTVFHFPALRSRCVALHYVPVPLRSIAFPLRSVAIHSVAFRCAPVPMRSVVFPLRSFAFRCVALRSRCVHLRSILLRSFARECVSAFRCVAFPLRCVPCVCASVLELRSRCFSDAVPLRF